MNTDKAYILGLVIGGGGFSANLRNFYIKLPYNQWGNVAAHPERAGIIAKDILKVVKPLMLTEYGMDVTFVTGRDWRIECIGNTGKLVKDLRELGVTPTSEIRKSADISGIVPKLIDDNLKRRFIAGIADTIGSMAPSHRRFSDDVQIISFEISGFAFGFVCQLCNLLYSIGCIPDQILWNHPNMHSGKDAYYSQWKKGFKLRVTLDAFSQFGALAFKSKATASQENRSRQNRTNVAEPCEDKRLSVNGVTARHVDEDYRELPEEIRGGHYIHHKQFCAVLNCPHAPLREVDCLLADACHHVSPFTVLHKDDAQKISRIILDDPLLRARDYRSINVGVFNVKNAVENGKSTIRFTETSSYFSDSNEVGYPLNTMLDAIAFIVASKTGALNGRRVRGNRDTVIENAIKANPQMTVEVRVPDLLTPIVVTDGKVSAMVGPLNAPVYKRLISFSPENRYKMVLRPITEEDLRG